MTQFPVGIYLKDFQVPVRIPSDKRFARKGSFRSQSARRHAQHQPRQRDGVPAMLKPAMAHPTSVCGWWRIAKCREWIARIDISPCLSYAVPECIESLLNWAA